MRHTSHRFLFQLVLSFTLFFAGIGLLPKCTIAAGGAESRVSEVRRTIRQACKELIIAQKDSVARQENLDTALRYTQSGQRMWLDLLADTAAIQTSEYRNHPDWSDSASSISLGIAYMVELIEQGAPSEAVKACGAGCKRFFRLNQASGVTRSSDELFQLRMKLKQLESAVDQDDFAQIETALPELIEFLPRTDEPIVGGTGNEPEIRKALAELSDRLIAIRHACQTTDATALQSTYKDALMAWDRAYGLLL